MTPEVKQRIIKRFLQEASTQPYVMGDGIVTTQPHYDDLAACLDALELNHNGLLDFAQVEADLPKWNQLKTVLNKGLTIQPGAPAQITKVVVAEMNKEARSIADERYLDGLPQPDASQRSTRIDAVTHAASVAGLMGTARDKLAALLTPVTNGTGFDKTSNEDVEHLITQLKAEIKRRETAGQDVALLSKQLTVAEDLLKVNKLTTMSIPTEGGPAVNYCTLAEAAGGVTEKVSLIRTARVTTQLGNLNAAAIGTIDDYINQRANYKLSTEAILKLPKHGKIEEVQRESMALNVSRMLGLDTTRSSIMMHAGKPALFVPFDNIKLMSEFARGKTFTGFASSKTYEHYSTINPVGAGLQPDRYINDFGNSLGLFYLCSDTDSMGGYNQNKALRDSRSLFIFDQVVMSADKFKLDSRLNLQPDEAFMKHTRHGQGRNRTLIEDSSLQSKFDSLVNLIQQQQRISKYADRTASAHQAKIDAIDRALRNPHTKAEQKQLNEEKKQFVALKEDTIKIKDAMNARINKIGAILPKRGPGLDNSYIFKSLVVEKLMHNPTLFTDTGRPYKNPWTYRQGNPVKTIERAANGNLLITFSSKVPGDMVGFLKRAGGLGSLRMPSNNQLEISQADLDRVNENMLHPESNPQINHQKDYLNLDDLKQIGKGYGEGHRTRILTLVDKYQKYMNAGHTTEEKLNQMSNTRSLLLHYIKDATQTKKDAGFGMHVLKKMYFDFQQELQLMMPVGQKPGTIDAAFAAALKLDQAGMFYQVTAAAIKNNKVDSVEFRDFLQACIDRAAQATNHAEAVQASTDISTLAQTTINTLDLPPVLQLDVVDDLELDAINPIERRVAILEDQRQALSGLVTPTPMSDGVMPMIATILPDTVIKPGTV